MLIFMKGCGNYQLTFNNLNFSLTEDELIGFANYLKRIDIDYWEKEYEHSIYIKKIPIPTLQSNFITVKGRELQFNGIAGKIEVFTVSGSLVKTQNDTKNSLLLDKSGVYIVKISTPQGIRNQKLIVY